MPPPDLAVERTVLLRSIAAASVLGLAGIAVGLATGSQIVLLNGAYAFIGVGVAWLLLLASGVVGQGPTHPYPYGREALTPIVVGVQGFVLLGTVAYAVVDAALSLLEGGGDVDAGWALVYAVITVLASVLLWRHLRAAAPESDLVVAEAAAWRVGALLALGMTVGLVAILVLEDTAWEGVVPLLDPIVVLVVSAVLLPTPWRMVRTTIVELLEGSPTSAIQEPVLAAVDEVRRAHGLEAPFVRMTKIGPKLYVEVDGAAPPETTVAEEHAVRSELQQRLDDLPLAVWLYLELFPDAVPHAIVPPHLRDGPPA